MTELRDHTMLLATRHKRTNPALLQPVRLVLDLLTWRDGG